MANAMIFYGLDACLFSSVAAVFICAATAFNAGPRTRAAARRSLVVELVAFGIVYCYLRSGVVDPTRELMANPNVDPAACGNTLSSAVCNPHGLLTAPGAARVNAVLGAIRGLTQHQCGESGLQGFQVAVALRQTMRVGRLEGAAAAAQRHAEETFNHWGVGHRACNNGVLIFVSKGR